MNPEEFWHRSEEYMAIVIPKVVPRDSWEVLATKRAKLFGTEHLDPTTLGQIVFMEIRAAFLFPQLDEGERLMMVGAWLATRNAKFASSVEALTPEAAQASAQIAKSEVEALEFIENVNLSEVQRDVALDFFVNATFERWAE